MDKNKIKSFAIWARKNLISAVSEKANRIGIYEDEIREAIPVQGGFKVDGIDGIFPFAKKDRDALVSQIREKGFEQVMEEVAYTWFNRFMGLRYMEVNEYLPSGVRILSSADKEKKEPDVLTKVSEIIDELELNAEEVYDLLDSGKTDDREKAYRIILVKQCNELGKIIPQMFEKITDYTELLLPDNLLENGSVIRKMVEDIEEDDWKEEVEIIGWMYQYYISEKKDEVFAALKKNVKITKENIPAATQLFTPKWIVKYMVENSLGRLWLEGHPNPELQNEWKYYLEEAEQEKEVEEELKKIREEHAKLTPLDIKVLDPCMGSGHILVYAFDVLYEIYKTAGYSEREIPRLILQNNLYGLDIDDRAAQLASFALIMKARHYNRRLFREIEKDEINLNLCSIQESNGISEEVIEYFANGNGQLKEEIKYLVKVFTDAKEYGSILQVEHINLELINERLSNINNEEKNKGYDERALLFGDFRKYILEKLPHIIKQYKIMGRKYEVCITNPPYMGRKSMGANLIKYLDSKYSNSKTDLYSVFIEVISRLTKKRGYEAAITQHSWMFLTSFEKLRKELLNRTLINMVHLGPRAFEEIGGEVVQSTAFVLLNSNAPKYNGSYIRLVDINKADLKEVEYLNRKYEKIGIDKMSSADIETIPGAIFAYWIDNKLISIFNNFNALSKFAEPRQGMATGDNEKFLRIWYEVGKINFNYNFEITRKWYPYNKGGSFRKWYGNNEYIVNWQENGVDIKSHSGSVIRNESYYLRSGITWSSISTGKISMRYSPKGFLFDSKGPVCFFFDDTNMYYGMALINSTVANEFLKILAPTLDFNQGPLSKLPFKVDNIDIVNTLVRNNIKISKYDWDCFETSWDFKVHPLLKLLNKNAQHKIESIFLIWETECEETFNQLKYNEEELNRIFIDIYGLQDELTPEVEDKDITIRKADRERDIKSFISYAVGCMFGRYSIDSEGLIYAGGEFNDKWNFEDKLVRNIEKDEEGNVVSDTWVNSRFMPDRENIIPITEDEYFEDDIVSRFIEFVKVVYGECNLEENLDFIADSIGRKSSETSREAIRRYFIKDFYKDHLKVYQKRPIYWLFESGKNDGFKCLVYMHRYNEQTIAKVRTDYLHILQRKYEAKIEGLQLIVDSEQYTTKERTAAKKKIDRISKQIEECREYDQVVAHLANEKISIDLDDGVKVNYAKFQNVEIINSKDKKVKMNLLAKI